MKKKKNIQLYFNPYLFINTYANLSFITLKKDWGSRKSIFYSIKICFCLNFQMIDRLVLLKLKFLWLILTK